MNTNSSKQLLQFSFIQLLLLAGLLFSLPAHANDQATIIGEIALTKGVVTARSDSRPLTALAKGSQVYLKDIIETASRSFTVIQFKDGGKVTLRPDSRFDLHEYDDTAGSEKQSFELLKGGLRAVTGAIGKAKPEQVKYAARNTTIGIRGTTFVIRLCKEGAEECNASDGVDGQGSLATGDSSNKYVDIFVVDKNGGSKQRISREQLRQLLEGVYVSVIDGAIRIETPTWFIDLAAGDKCLIDYSDNPSLQRSGNDQVECFIKGPGLEDGDVFLSEEAEKITKFNLFDDSEVYVGESICEIN